MAKFFGAIGYSAQVESNPGVWEDVIIERTYSGEILQNARHWSNSDAKVNEDLELDDRVSVVADIFAYANLPHIRYVILHGTKWKVKKVDINRPRLILSLGGVYVGGSSSSGTP